jgi:hypothetical protein
MLSSAEQMHAWLNIEYHVHFLIFLLLLMNRFSLLLGGHLSPSEKARTPKLFKRPHPPFQHHLSCFNQAVTVERNESPTVLEPGKKQTLVPGSC